MRPLCLAPQGSRTNASRPQPRLAKTWVWLGGGGGGVFHALPKPLMVDYSSPHPFPPVPQARLGAWPPVCWQDWGWGGGEATSNCPGKTSSLLTSLLSRRRGKRPGQAHPMPGSYLSPPSSLTLLFSPRPKQAWAPRPGAERAVLALRRSRNQAHQRLLSEGSARPGVQSLPILGLRRWARTGSLRHQGGSSTRPGLL